MTYTAEQPPLAESSDQLRARIPGWGVDLDPQDRPSVPKLRWQEDRTGAHWEFPERQPEKWPRERSIEHKFLTPVFGTSCPPQGHLRCAAQILVPEVQRGARRALAAPAGRRPGRRLGEPCAFVPDRCVRTTRSRETGVLSEFSRHGVSSRVGKNRADVRHQMLDPIIVGGPWVLAGGLVFWAVRKVAGSIPASPTNVTSPGQRPG